ncbi:DUF1453 domain-containing protein [Streptomyces sp. NPDC060198]|uniref:DUF1453 domain-containing protein n=1 Tax=Streptomyces sp. NPDC060198 TaxID=3347070 RepID=UPI003657F538
MSGVASVLVMVAVAGWTLLRQFSARPLPARWWLLPGILAVLSLRGGVLLDPRHETVSAGVLAAELMVGLGLGAGWGLTTRVWRDADGTPWSRGTRATSFVWAGGLALRAILWAAGAAKGVEQSGDGLLLALAVTLLVRGAVLSRRLEPSFRIRPNSRGREEPHLAPASAGDAPHRAETRSGDGTGIPVAGKDLP